jgi:hypothetical protein
MSRARSRTPRSTLPQRTIAINGKVKAVMPKVANYPNDGFDVFISYAKAENDIPAGAGKGWVTVFFETLRAELGKSAYGKQFGIQLWWDQTELDGSAPLHPQILDTLPKTQLIVVLLSPSYLKSDWCEKERAKFLAAKAGQPLADKRVFLVDLGNVQRDDRPEEFQDLVGFPFHSEGEKFGHPVPDARFERHLSFFSGVKKLAERIASRLAELGPRAPQTETAKSRQTDPAPLATVYLSETTNDLDELREQLAEDLNQHGFRVIPDDRLPKDLEQCRQRINKWLDERPVLFVQLLGPNPWMRFKNSDETVATLQYRCAAAHLPGIPILQWRDKTIDVDAIVLPGLKTLLANPDVRTEPLETFKSEIRLRAAPPKPKLAIPQERLASGKLPPAVFVQSDTVDVLAAEHLSEALKQQLQLRSWWPKSSDDPGEQIEYRDMQQEWLEECDAIVLLYGIAKAIKVEQLIQRLWKVQQKRAKPLRVKALYIGPPQNKPRLSLGDPQIIEIDGSRDTELSVAKLEPVLEALWQEAAT